MAGEVTELAGYRIESQLGRGGMGVVYRAHDLALERKVALKLLAPEFAGDVRFRERFLRESRLAASLDHPSIIPIYDAGEAAGQLYIAMRLVEGADLKRLLAEEGVMEPEQALRLLEQVAEALDAAHERGLVHRDVKPSNVLVDERGHCYLADFGLSRRLAEQQTGVGSGGSLGTVDYVAPEQIRGEQVDGRADLYSLGCLLYECLSGRPPYVRGSDTAIVFAHLEEDAPGLPRLDSVIRKALAKEPDDRYRSGRELIAAARLELRAETRPRRRRLLAAGLVLAAAGAATGAVLVARESLAPAHSTVKPPSIRLEANAFNLIDARTRRVIAKVGGGRYAHLAHGATDVAFVDGSAWFSVGAERRLVRFDLAKKRVTAVVRLPWTPTERIAAGGGIVWLREARNLGTAVLGIDARSGRVVRRFPNLGGSSVGIAYGDGSLWLVGGAEMLRIDPRSGRILHRFPAVADWLVVGDGAVWAASTDGSVWKIDPVANAITARAKLHGWLSDLAVGGSSVWVSIVGENAVYRLSDDDLSEQRAIPSGPDPERISVGGGFVWVVNTRARMLTLLAKDTGARKQLATGTNPTTAQFHDGLVWIAAERGLPPLPPIRGTELRVAASLFNVDPVSRVFPMDEQLSNATCANLLDYTDSAVPGGAFRPEIAAAMPTLSADGRTYTFHIRSGFRFSPPSNEPVTAETFRHTIERTLYKTAQGWPDHYLPDIVGATAYSGGKVTHISGITARGALLTITLVQPAGDFLTRLSLPVFCPVPLATPLDAKRTAQPIPSTGPYYIALAEDHRTVLLRNPNYPGSRPRNAERIVITDDIPTPKAVALVDNGQLDYLPTDFSSPQLGIGGPLDRRYGPASANARAGRQRFFRHMQPMVDLIVFNTRRPLFHDAPLRRAVGYALDRTALAKAYFDVPDGRVIPAAIPGYETSGVYPLAPDLGEARRLAGRKHRHAILLAACIPQSVPELVRSELAAIGVAVSIVHLQDCPRAVPMAFKRADLLIGASLQCGPCNRDPAEFFRDVLDHGAYGTPLSLGGWNERDLRRSLARAAPLRGTLRIGAFIRLGDQLARAAPFLVYGAFQYAEYFSARVGCKSFPLYSQGVELGALCVRN